MMLKIDPIPNNDPLYGNGENGNLIPVDSNNNGSVLLSKLEITGNSVYPWVFFGLLLQVIVSFNIFCYAKSNMRKNI